MTTTDARIDSHRVTRPRGRALPVAVIVAVALLALVHLPFPFTGDQALFTYYARAMRHGDLLYVDRWDFKQPGIYLFYLVSGTAFGFNEVGVHIAELIWAIALALCLQRVLRERVTHRFVADISPLLTVGAFLAAARSWDLTQVEALVALPLLLSIWAAADAGFEQPTRRRRLPLSGVAAAAVVYFKLVYGVIPIVFWIYVVHERRRDAQTDTAARDATALTTGFVAPLLPLFAYFVHERLLSTMWWTYVVYPQKLVRSIDPPTLSRLLDGVGYFAKSFAGLVVLVVAAIAMRARGERLRLRSHDPFAIGIVLWLVVGLLSILMQNQWGYQFMLLVVPLGVLGALALDRLVGEWRSGTNRAALRVVAVAVIVLAVSPALTLSRSFTALARHRFAVTQADRNRFEDEVGGDYATARLAADWVRAPGRAPGPIHVEGNALIQYLSGRRAALRVHGWSPHQSDAKLWRSTQDDLQRQRPVYLFVDALSQRIMAERSPTTLTEIAALYCAAATIGDGTWYALDGNRDCV
jgi:hypothetical protein